MHSLLTWNSSDFFPLRYRKMQTPFNFLLVILLCFTHSYIHCSMHYVMKICTIKFSWSTCKILNFIQIYMPSVNDLIPKEMGTTYIYRACHQHPTPPTPSLPLPSYLNVPQSLLNLNDSCHYYSLLGRFCKFFILYKP